MRSKRMLMKLTIGVMLIVVALLIGLHGTTNKSATDGGDGIISLEAPFFISAAEASPLGSAFPADEAGMSAYVNLQTPIAIDKVKTIFTEVKDVGENYIIGIVPIANYRQNTEVHLYADMDGWLVAYFTREEPAAKIMKWPEKYNFQSPMTKITTTTLQEALRNAGQASGVGIPREIKYSDFRVPDANAMTVFVKTRGPQGIMQMKIPADWMLYEVSYQAATSGYEAIIKVDGTQINLPRYALISDSYQGTITTGVLHTIELTGPNNLVVPFSVATVLIYKKN
jgi:hypothetical protein